MESEGIAAAAITQERRISMLLPLPLKGHGDLPRTRGQTRTHSGTARTRGMPYAREVLSKTSRLAA